MMKQPHPLVNIAILNLVWFAAVLGAANNLYWLGPVSALIGIIVQFRSSLKEIAFLRFLGITLILGMGIDALIIMLGAISFPCCSLLPNNYPLWMLSLWLIFATTLFSSLSWLKKKFALGSFLACVGGAASYYAGYKLGALNLALDQVNALVIIGLAWAVAFPAMCWTHIKIFSRE